MHTGTYVNDNYAAEPGLIKNIFEANIGVALNSKRNIWIDVGVFPSHIGFETAISADNWTMTRSLLAENSPYFLSGAKLSYVINEKLTILALVCNGWQRIKRVEGNGLLSFGTQITYKPSERFYVNWSSFIGTDDPDVQRRMRYFNNFYAQFLFSQKLGLIAGFDIGLQQKQFKSAEYESWWSPVFIFQYKINSFWNTAFRTEYYHDESVVIIPTEGPSGFKTSGLSYNLDYLPAPNLTWRWEARYL